MEAMQDEEKVHYSYGIPSKNISDYELLSDFDSLSDLDQWLSKEYGENISEDDMNKPPKSVIDVLADDLNTSQAIAEINQCWG